MIVGNGRPLRFLMMVGGGWIGLRVLLLWPTTGSLPDAIRRAVPLPGVPAVAEPNPAPSGAQAPTKRRVAVTTPRPIAPRTAEILAAAASPRAATPVDPIRVQLALLALTRISGTANYGPEPANPAVPGTAMQPRFVAASPSRWSVSSWAIVRGGGSPAAQALAPQLGGTQGGIRVDYALGSGFAATGRLASPAAGAGREASLGLAWRPKGAPVRLVAEQRFALDGGRGGPALGISGGVSAVRMPAGFRLESYAQAGGIARVGIEPYLDASVRSARPIAELAGITLDLGGGAWGGAPRGVGRLDIGPSLELTIPVAGRSVRAALDWRHRIAGNARPGSGPALTLGTDF